nr:hypothetical protein [Gammaproteobacteria bacterium]
MDWTSPLRALRRTRAQARRRRADLSLYQEECEDGTLRFLVIAGSPEPTPAGDGSPGSDTLQSHRRSITNRAVRNPSRRFVVSFVLVVVAIAGVAVGQAALAESDDTAASASRLSKPEAATATLDGQQVYNNVCIACHHPPGIGGAPAIGDRDAWAPRIAQGMETLIDHALRGYSGSTGIMPRKGGRLDLSDEEIIGAVEYMVEQATP